MKTRIPILAAVLAAGFAAALTLGVSQASAWNWQGLPAGYGVSSYQTVCHVATDPCVNGEGSTCNHVTITAPNTVRYQLAETDCVNPTFQADVDQFIADTICTVNPAAGGQACVPATTAPPPDTTTAAATTSQPSQPAPSQPAPPAATDTTTATTDPVALLQSQLDALAQQLADLTTRVEKLELAGNAAEVAFEQSLAGGADTAAAATVARGTYLNAVYGLGQFAP